MTMHLPAWKVVSDWFMHVCREARDNRMLIWISLVAAIASFQYGVDIGLLPGVLANLRQDSEFGNQFEGVQVAIARTTNGGAIFGGLIGVVLADWHGRKKGILCADFLFLVGYAMMAIPHLVAMFVARFMIGIGLGVAAVVCPLYVYEYVPSTTRGRFMSLSGICMTLGQTFAYIVTQVLFQVPGWRWMLLVAGIPAAVQALFMWQLRETPRWLLLTDQVDEALQVLLLHYPENRALRLFEEIRSLIAHVVPHFQTNPIQRIITNLYWAYSNLDFKKSLMASIILNTTHILGVGTTAYSERLDGATDGSADSLLLGSLLNVVAAFATFLTIDFLSRRKIIKISLILVSLLFLTLSLISYNDISPAVAQGSSLFSNHSCVIPEAKWDCIGCLQADCAFCGSSDLTTPGDCLKYEKASQLLCLQEGRTYVIKICPTKWAKLTTILIKAFGIVHSYGLTSVPVIVTLELFAVDFISIGSGIGLSTGWLFCLFGSLIFQPLGSNNGGLYISVTLCSSIILAVIWFFVPEAN